MQLVALIFLCAIFYALFEIFAGLAGGKINDWLAAVLYNGIGTVIPLIVYFAISAKGKTTGRGITFAALAGIAIMLFSVLLARIFNKGGNLTYVIPTIYGTAIVISSLFGWLVLKEKVSGLQAVGLGLVVLGVGCIVLAKLKLA
jgi:bacterial/archaeal transporter family protein